MISAPLVVSGPESLQRVLALRKGRLRKIRSLRPRPIFPYNAAKKYVRFVQGLADGFARQVKLKTNLLLKSENFDAASQSRRTDAAGPPYDPAMLSRQIQELKRALTYLWDTTASDRSLQGTVAAFAADFAAYNSNVWLKMLTAQLGIDVILYEPWLTGHMDSFTAENMSLIKGIGDKLTNDITHLLLSGVRAGRRHEDMAAEISQRLGIETNRAKLIARDQTLKFNGSLSKIRQENLGVKRFIWRTAGDERVRGNPSGLYPRSRPSHWAVNNKIFSWDSRPRETGGHFPGEAILCRCWAEPILDDLLDGAT